MLKLLSLVALLIPIIRAQNIDDIIADVFKPGSDNEARPGEGIQVKQPETSSTKAPDLPPNRGGETGSNGIPGIGCTCVPYYLCNNGTINTNGIDIIDIRIDEREGGPPRQCANYLQTCCGKEDISEKPVTAKPPPINKDSSGCGYRNPDGTGFRITGDKDHEAQFGEFPWMVAVLREEQVDGNSGGVNQKLNIYQCGGALVHPSIVVTAAHCVNGKNKQFKVRAGEWDTQTTDELLPHQDREVRKIIVHPDFYAGALFNDVAVLFLESPVDLAENINPLCLPKQDEVIPANTECIASGWGKDVFGKKGKYQVILKRVELPIVSRAPCQEKLRTTRLGQHFELHKSFICAGGVNGKDTCKGDGGSPLVCPVPGQKNRYFHAGIVAWGIGCGENNTPGVYVNVPLFRDWIDTQIRNENFDPSLYQV